MTGMPIGPKWLAVLLWGLGVLGLTPPLARGDVLDEIRSEVRSPNEPPSSAEPERQRSRRSHHDACDEDDDDCHPFREAVGWAVLYTVASPFWAPVMMLEDEYPRLGYFPRYPYENDQPGFIVFRHADTEDVFTYATRLSFEYADDFADMKRIGGNVVFETSRRFGIDSEAHYREESLPNNQHDELWTGDFNFVFRFAQSERVQMRAGVGFNWLSDERDTDFGFNFTYGGDWMLGSPWIASGVIDIGTLGEATLFHGRATLGAQFHGVEVFTGYDYFSIDSAHINGLVGGLRFWF